MIYTKYFIKNYQQIFKFLLKIFLIIIYSILITTRRKTQSTIDTTEFIIGATSVFQLVTISEKDISSL